MSKRVRIVKLDDIEENKKSNKSTKYTKTKTRNKYEDILNSTERIKELLKNKMKTKKKEEEEFKSQFNNKKTKVATKANEIKKETKQPRTQKKSKMKTVNINKQTINYIFKKITENKYSKDNLIEIFKTIIKTNDSVLTNKFIIKINRKQTILLLSYLHIVSIESTAPLPLLKNLLYNFLTSNINIIR